MCFALCYCILESDSIKYMLLTKTTTAQNEGALSYHRVLGLHFLVVVFVATICQYTFFHV